MAAALVNHSQAMGRSNLDASNVAVWVQMEALLVAVGLAPSSCGFVALNAVQAWMAVQAV